MQTQKDQISTLKRANRQPLKSQQSPKEPNTGQKTQLSVPLCQCLNLETRTLNIFRQLEFKTLEDLLKYSKIHGLNSLKNLRGFGETSLARLKTELIENGIFEESGYCELYDYIATSELKWCYVS